MFTSYSIVWKRHILQFLCLDCILSLWHDILVKIALLCLGLDRNTCQAQENPFVHSLDRW